MWVPFFVTQGKPPGAVAPRRTASGSIAPGRSIPLGGGSAGADSTLWRPRVRACSVRNTGWREMKTANKRAAPHEDLLVGSGPNAPWIAEIPLCEGLTLPLKHGAEPLRGAPGGEDLLHP